MRFKKIKYSDSQVHLELENVTGGGDEQTAKDVISIKSGKEPREEFHVARRGLKNALIELCEVQGLPKDAITVTGVSLAYKGEYDDMHCVITGYRTLKNSAGSQPLNTPQKAAELTEESKPEPGDILDEKTIESLKAFIAEAEEYYRGTKLQTELLA